MQINKILIGLFLLCLMIYSCSTIEKSEGVESTICLDIPVKKLPEIKLSEVISDFKVVKLEFTEQSMIGSVRKVVIHNGLIYILDTFGAKGVLVFNMDGKFIRRIGSVGNGPGQYTIPQDFLIDTLKNEVEILGNRKIICFTITGDYLRNQKIKFTGVNFIKDKHGYYFAITGKEEYKVFRTDLKGNIQQKYLPTYKQYESGCAFMCFVSPTSTEHFYRPVRRDTIYSFNGTEAVPSRIINFGNYKFDLAEFQKLDFMRQMKFLKKGKNINQCIVRNYFENEKYINLCYNMSGKFYNYILNKKSGKYVHYGEENLIDDVTWEKESSWMVGGDNKHVYYNIEPYKYKSTKQLRKFLESFTSDEEKIQEMIHETSNPIILLAKYSL